MLDILAYFECSSKSIDSNRFLTLFAFFESFFRIAEQSNPVTKKIKLCEFIGGNRFIVKELYHICFIMKTFYKL